MRPPRNRHAVVAASLANYDGSAGTLVDTNVWIDCIDDGSVWHAWAQEQLQKCSERSPLHVNPIIYTELLVPGPGVDVLDALLDVYDTRRSPPPLDLRIVDGGCLRSLPPQRRLEIEAHAGLLHWRPRRGREPERADSRSRPIQKLLPAPVADCTIKRDLALPDRVARRSGKRLEAAWVSQATTEQIDDLCAPGQRRRRRHVCLAAALERAAAGGAGNPGARPATPAHRCAAAGHARAFEYDRTGAGRLLETPARFAPMPRGVAGQPAALRALASGVLVDQGMTVLTASAALEGHERV